MITVKMLDELERHVTAFGERYANVVFGDDASFDFIFLDTGNIEFSFEKGRDQYHPEHTLYSLTFDEFVEIAKDYDAYFEDMERDKVEKAEEERLEKMKKRKNLAANKRRREIALCKRLKTKHGL